MTTPRMMIVWQVLEIAKDCNDNYIIAACRRLIVANRRGWKKHAAKKDISIVWDFA